MALAGQAKQKTAWTQSVLSVCPTYASPLDHLCLLRSPQFLVLLEPKPEAVAISLQSSLVRIFLNHKYNELILSMNSCETCINRIFMSQTVVACPVCRTPLRRSSFVQQTWEDRALERENTIRRKILKEYVT